MMNSPKDTQLPETRPIRLAELVPLMLQSTSSMEDTNTTSQLTPSLFQAATTGTVAAKANEESEAMEEKGIDTKEEGKLGTQ